MDGALFVQGGGAYGGKEPENILNILLALEDYMSLVRLAKSGYPLKLDTQAATIVAALLQCGNTR